MPATLACADPAGTIDHSGYLRKFFFSRAPVKDPTRNDIISYKEQFALGAGVEYTSRSEDVLLGLVSLHDLLAPWFHTTYHSARSSC